jgi:Ser/Thr protein kinase RdoA (MazF antagonist)
MGREHDVARSFDFGGDIAAVEPHGRGLINDTFLVTTTTGRQAILQRLNRRVFHAPERVMANLRLVSDHVRRTPQRGAVLRLPEIVATRAGKDFVIDDDGGFWRALGYIEKTRTLTELANARQAGQVGFALGRFHALLHHLAQLDAVVAGASAGIEEPDVEACLRTVERRRELAAVLESAKRSGALTELPVHGDPKLNNFLFDSAGNRCEGLIDLDTVQPGLLHCDVGDCLRSGCNRAGESPADLAAVRFDAGLAQAILEGYFAETAAFLSHHDWEHFYDAIRLIPFELGLRFLTDHLEGDAYFKVKHRGHNLQRARVQFRLLEQIEDAEGEIRRMLAAMRKD